MKLDEAIKTLSEHRQDFDNFGVKSLAIFGSVARNEARSDSDIDLLVEFSKPVGLFEFVDLKNYLEKLFGCQVDVGTPASLKASIRDQVLKEAVYVS